MADESSAQESVPPVLARLYGQTFLEFPPNLYIPPDALEIMLEAFEGPLDLLLYLIRRANLDIFDIPMAALTRQYLEYVEAMRAVKLELAAEYLVMAATLIEIKSRMLLPRPADTRDEEADDPRAELARRLLEYERIRGAARQIDAMPWAGRDFLWAEALIEKTLARHDPVVTLADLQSAWRGILRQSYLTRRHEVRRETLSVREHMSFILRALADAGGDVRFEALMTPEMGVPKLVIHFVALLELARERLVDLTQLAAFGPIYIRRAEAAVLEMTPDNERELDTHGTITH
ncbi:MAG: segregation/condensation protein A [Zoogloeaceae bacterium]|nr:segregation/condensation protein A [Zoogloeaceae bacterium]